MLSIAKAVEAKARCSSEDCSSKGTSALSATGPMEPNADGTTRIPALIYQMGGGGQAPLSNPMPQAFRQAYQMIQPVYPPQGVYAVQPMGHPMGQHQGQQQLSNSLPKEAKEESMVMAECNEMRTHMQQSPDAETRRKRSGNLMKTLFKAFTKDDIADPNLV
jgi:hypothetical protein